MLTIAKEPNKSIDHKEYSAIGYRLHREGVHSYPAVHASIRALNTYYWDGDKELNIPSMKNDNVNRATLVFQKLTEFLEWSKEKLEELWQGILSVVFYRPGWMKPIDIPDVPIPSTNSLNSKSSKNVQTILTICEPEANSKEEKYPSKEEVRDIFKTVLGNKYENPMMATMLRALRL